MTTIDAKRGATFRTRFRITADDLTDTTVTAQVRRWSGEHVADLTVDKIADAIGWVEISANADGVAAWPIDLLVCDIRAELPSGEVYATETFQINVIKEVTQ